MASGTNNLIVYLRGIAALMVCFCHFRLALPEALRGFAKAFGELGVQIFFVISGYIIPYSLDRGGYRLADFGRFWLKRLLRLQPVYLAALLLTCALSVLAGAVKGGASPLNAIALLKSSIYVTIPAENPVIWTLIVELKYYLFIAVLFPLLFSKTDWIRRVSFGIGCVLALWGTSHFEWFRYLPMFLIGFCGCYVATRRAGRIEFVVLMAAAVGVAAMGSTLPQILAGISTCLAILLFSPGDWKLAGLYGSISYSLYLVHFPVGVKFLNLMLPKVSGLWGHLLLGAVTLAGCTGVAYGLFRLVERPSTQWSHQVRFSAQKLATAKDRPASSKNLELPSSSSA